VPCVLECCLYGAVGWIQFRRDLEFDHRFFVAFGGGESASAIEMLLGGAQAGALEGAARVAIVGIGADGLGVFDDREIVVLHAFCALAGAQGAAGGAAGRQAHRQQHGSSPESHRLTAQIRRR
jgi:hypothetical protein